MQNRKTCHPLHGVLPWGMEEREETALKTSRPLFPTRHDGSGGSCRGEGSEVASWHLGAVGGLLAMRSAKS